jgi:hypothetical protein
MSGKASIEFCSCEDEDDVFSGGLPVLGVGARSFEAFIS